MSWLDFANYFLSNQKLHAWSWINRTSLGNGFFCWVFRLLCVFFGFGCSGLSLFCSSLFGVGQESGPQDLVSNLNGQSFPIPSCLNQVTIALLFFFSFQQFCTLFRHCLVQRTCFSFLFSFSLLYLWLINYFSFFFLSFASFPFCFCSVCFFFCFFSFFHFDENL